MTTAVEQPMKVVGILVRHKGKLVMMGRQKPKPENIARQVETYTFIGGRVEQGETLQQAALRETNEEVKIAGQENGLVPSSPELMQHVNGYNVILEENGKPARLDIFFYDADADGVTGDLVNNEFRADGSPVPLELVDHAQLQVMRQRSFDAVQGVAKPGKRLLLPNHIVMADVIERLEDAGKLDFTPVPQVVPAPRRSSGMQWRPAVAVMASFAMGALAMLGGMRLAPVANATPTTADVATPAAPAAGPCDGLDFDFGVADDGYATVSLYGQARTFEWQQLPEGGIAAPESLMTGLPGTAQMLIARNALAASDALRGSVRPTDGDLAVIAAETRAAVCGR